ncbi:unnamed protein product [Alternaria alternata]
MAPTLKQPTLAEISILGDISMSWKRERALQKAFGLQVKSRSQPCPHVFDEATSPQASDQGVVHRSSDILCDTVQCNEYIFCHGQGKSRVTASESTPVFVNSE